MGKIFIAAASIEGFLASGSHSMKYMQNVLKNGRSLGTACLSCQKKHKIDQTLHSQQSS